MPANVLIDRAPTQQRTAANQQHAAPNAADSMVDVYCGHDPSATALLHSNASSRPSAGLQPPIAAHQLALDLAKLASSLTIGVVSDAATSASSVAMPTSLSLSSNGVGNTSPVLAGGPIVATTAGAVAGTFLSELNGKLNASAMTVGGRKSANMTECVPVPSSEHVAEIVGRQGSKIKALRAKTNTYIKTPVRGEEPVFVVTGRREDVAAAKREILSASEHFSQIRASRLNAGSATGSPGAVSNGGGRPSPHGGSSGDSSGQMTIHVRVPYRVVGLVVGPKGATIKRIQQDSSTYIVTPSRDREPVFEVTGTCDGVEKARRDIESYIALRTGSAPEPPAVPPCHAVGPLTAADLRDVDPRVLLNSLLTSPAPSVRGQNGTGGSSAAMLSYNNAINLGRMTAMPNDISANGGCRELGTGVAGPLKLGQYAAAAAIGNGFQCDKAKSFYHGLFDYDGGTSMRPEFDKAQSNNIINNNNVVVPSTLDTWTASSAMDLASINLRSLLPLSGGEEFAGLRYPSGDIPSLDSLVGNYPVAGPPTLDASQPVDGAGFFGGGSGSDCSGSGSSPTAASSQSETVASPRRLRTVPGCLCFLCGEAPVSAALVPCGHNMFCKTCADTVVAGADLTDRRCPVCGEPSCVAVRILS